MYARVTKFKFSSAVGTELVRLAQGLTPILRKHPGFDGLQVLTDLNASESIIQVLTRRSPLRRTLPLQRIVETIYGRVQVAFRIIAGSSNWWRWSDQCAADLLPRLPVSRLDGLRVPGANTGNPKYCLTPLWHNRERNTVHHGASQRKKNSLDIGGLYRLANPCTTLIITRLGWLSKLPLSRLSFPVAADPKLPDDLEVEDGLLKCTEQPQPDGQQHLGTARGGDISQVDDVGLAEAPEQLGHS